MTFIFDTTPGAHREAGVQKLFGKYPAVVIDNTAPSGAAHTGALLVELAMVLEESAAGSGNRRLRTLARPAFLPGFFFVPEVGAQVWVEFVAGNVDFPVWTGVWYPTNAPPQTPDNNNPTEASKLIRTRAGHVIAMDDTSGSEKLIIQHKSGTSIEIDPAGKVTITDVNNDTSIVSGKISLGTAGGATAHLVLGEELKGLLQTLLSSLATYVNHVHPTGVGPSGPSPLAPSAANDIASCLGNLNRILSKQNTTD